MNFTIIIVLLHFAYVVANVRYVLRIDVHCKANVIVKENQTDIVSCVLYYE